jgi:hypothetical protein
MKSVSLKTLALISLLTLGACAHHRDVRPSEDGVHRVILMTPEKNFDGQEALGQAQHYCEEQKERAVIVSESNQYIGSMDENSYSKAQTAAKVAQSVGSAAYIFGGKKESNAGGVVGLGGIAAQGAIGSGYRFEMKFKCQ